MSESSLSLFLLEEPALEAAMTPSPPPQSGEHNMRRRSQGIKTPRSLLDTHLRRHTQTHLDEGNFPNVATPAQTPRRILHGVATSSLELVGTRSDARSLAPQRMARPRRVPLEDAPRPSRPMPRPQIVPLVNATRPMTTL